jgi:5-methylcytosine-specific restriction endonuclease McrA
MAEINYKRLTCIKSNDNLFRKLAKPSIPKRRYTPKNPPGVRDCVTCGVTFWAGSGKKYCSVRCTYGSPLTRDQYRNAVQANAKQAFTCLHCGVASKRGMSSTSTQKGYCNKYCSMSCRVARCDLICREVEFLRKLADRRQPGIGQQTRAIRDVARAIASLARKKHRALMPCLICGKAVGYMAGRPSIYCSKSCTKKTDSYKARQRAAKSRRNAVERGCKEARSIDPIKVLERDGWRCQICGVSTPQTLRGTYNKRAPELDHVVPISKGGLHTWTNLQCACRECNGAKSDKSCAGQMGLFTALL